MFIDLFYYLIKSFPAKVLAFLLSTHLLVNCKVFPSIILKLELPSWNYIISWCYSHLIHQSDSTLRQTVKCHCFHHFNFINHQFKKKWKPKVFIIMCYSMFWKIFAIKVPACHSKWWLIKSFLKLYLNITRTGCFQILHEVLANPSKSIAAKLKSKFNQIV